MSAGRTAGQSSGPGPGRSAPTPPRVKVSLSRAQGPHPPGLAFEAGAHLPLLLDSLLQSDSRGHGQAPAVPSHPALLLLWDPCQAYPPLPVSTQASPPLSSSAPPHRARQPLCPLCSLPPGVSLSTYCWHHCSGLSQCCLVIRLHRGLLFSDPDVHVRGSEAARWAEHLGGR